MKTPAPADLHRWSEELARNPASLAFLPLARAYRRLGRRDLALQLCLRGLEYHPTHVEAHALLALLYFEGGERAKAADEWATVLRLKPGNFEALRGMGFRYLEQGDLGKARQNLERAALIRPDDATVQEALRLIRHREAAAPPRGMGDRPPRHSPQPPPSPARPPVRPHAAQEAVQPRAGSIARPPQPATQSVRREPLFQPGWEQSPASPPPPSRPAPPPAPPPDPTRVFESLLGSGPLLGVLLLDRRGLILAGSLTAEDASSDELGANLGGAIDEAVCAVTHLQLGSWHGLMIECSRAVLHVLPVTSDSLIVVAAQRNAPAGWISRAAAHAASLAERFVQVYS